MNIILLIIICVILYFYLFRENFAIPSTTPMIVAINANNANNANNKNNNNNLDNKSKGKSCFLYNQTVKLESGEIKEISKIKIGDRVLCVNSEGEFVYSDVVYIPHDYNKDKNTFIELRTNTNKTIKMTKCHLIPTLKNKMVKAEDIEVDDKIITLNGIETIKEINVNEDYGFYTIITNDEYLVVNDIVVSPFGGGMNHDITHKLCNVFRTLYKFNPNYDKSKLIQTNLELLYNNHIENLLL